MKLKVQRKVDLEDNIDLPALHYRRDVKFNVRWAKPANS